MDELVVIPRPAAEVLNRLAEAAWQVRENARVVGRTKVGCAILGRDGRVFSGCNVEHRFRCHDVHAEINAITNMVSLGCEAFTAMVITAERERFLPCGGCMDWIMEFGGPDAMIGFQNARAASINFIAAHELMPRYPS
jgi:cytidine deaminase